MGPIKEEWTSADGQHRILLGDCLEILSTLDTTEVAAVVADPPYGIGYNRGPCGKAANYSGRKLAKGTERNLGALHGDDREFDPSPWLVFPSVFLWGADHFAQRLPHGRFLAWDKLDGKDSWDSFSDVEFAWHNKRGAARIIRYVWKGLCQGTGEDKGSTRDHPTQKPVVVMRWSLEQAGTQPGDLILDPYAGSCTVAVACARTGRRSISIEIERKYWEIGIQRMEREAKRHPLLEPAKPKQLAFLTQEIGLSHCRPPLY